MSSAEHRPRSRDAGRQAVAGRSRLPALVATVALCASLPAVWPLPAATQEATSVPPAWDPAVEKRWDRRPASLGIENAYRDTLAAWARGVDTAATRYAAFQLQVVEGIIGTRVTPANLRTQETGRAQQCLASTERNTQELLRVDDPEVLPVVYAFQLELFLYHLQRPGQVWLAEFDWERLDALWRSFRGRESAPPSSSDEMLALVFIETGARLEEQGLIGQLAWAREAFERAIEHSPDNVAARYRTGFLAEKLGLLRRARRQFDWLVERDPDDHEVRLRRALTAGRLGSTDETAGELSDLTRAPVEPWIRGVAFQESARILAETDREAAVDLLRQAVDELPAKQGLEVQLAFHLGPGSSEGTRILEQVVGRRQTTEEPSVRGRYEEGRMAELRRERARFAVEIDRRRVRLVEVLERIEHLEMARYARRRHRGLATDQVREVFLECRGYESPERRRGRR